MPAIREAEEGDFQAQGLLGNHINYEASLVILADPVSEQND